MPIKVRNIAPYGLRLPPPLRKALEDASKKSHRSLNTEIVTRLEQSLTSPQHATAEPTARAYNARSDAEQAMLDVFRQMTPEKQLALLSLFK